MSKSKDDNKTKESYTLMFKHVDSLANINNNASEKEEDSPPPPFPHVDSMVLLGAITIIGTEGSIDGGVKSPDLKENSDSSG